MTTPVSASSTSSPRVMRSPRDRRTARRERWQLRLARHARGRPGALPERRRLARRSRPRRDARAVPVAPAAHYMVGGIVADLDGRSTPAGPLRRRRVACTGLHGANRLASNSLSECFVFGRPCRARRAQPSRLAGRARPERVATPSLAVGRRHGVRAVGAARGCVEAPRASSACSRIRTRSLGLIARLRACPQREPGRHVREPTHPQADPALDAMPHGASTPAEPRGSSVALSDAPGRVRSRPAERHGLTRPNSRASYSRSTLDR